MLSNLTATGSLAKFVELLCANLPAHTVLDMAIEATSDNPFSDEAQSIMEAVGQVIIVPGEEHLHQALSQSAQKEFEQYIDELAECPF